MQLNEDDEFLLRNANPGPSRSEPCRVGLAVSGGGDSIALLHLRASQAATDPNRHIFVATVNHGLRPEAEEECKFVAEICKGYNFPHTVLPWKDWDGTGNLQAQARDARYKLLAQWAFSLDLDGVDLGHTQDDVAENFLLRLKRQSGLDGLAAMETTFSRHGCTFTRPLLYDGRETIRRYLRRNNFKWMDDPSNDDRAFDRVRARDALKALAALGIDSVSVANSAQNLKGEKWAAQQAVADFCKEHLGFEAGDICIPELKLEKLPDEYQRRVMREAVAWMGNRGYPPRSLSLDDWDFKIGEGKPYMVHGCALIYSNDMIRIAREFNVVRDLVAKTDEIWDGRWQLDGPHAPHLEIRALGSVGLPQCPDWRTAGLPRTSLLASPAIWSGDQLIAAPLAKLNPEWTATLLRCEKQFFSSIVPH